MRDKNQFEIIATANYIEAQSEPEEHRYVFSYTINITNRGEAGAKLTHRHWHITDANGKVEEVHGKGVIGEQPFFEPGDSYEYSSGVMLETPVGVMHGHYDMLDGEGNTIEAEIPPFSLHVPGSLH